MSLLHRLCRGRSTASPPVYGEDDGVGGCPGLVGCYTCTVGCHACPVARCTYPVGCHTCPAGCYMCPVGRYTCPVGIAFRARVIVSRCVRYRGDTSVVLIDDRCPCHLLHVVVKTASKRSASRRVYTCVSISSQISAATMQRHECIRCSFARGEISDCGFAVRKRQRSVDVGAVMLGCGRCGTVTGECVLSPVFMCCG